MVSSVAGAAVTGMGAICSIGKELESMLESLRASRAGFEKITAFDTEGLKVRYAAETHDFKPSDHFSAKECGVIDRSAQLAIVAVREAVASAGLGPDELASGRVGLAFGVCAGGVGNGQVLSTGPEAWENEADARAFYNTAHYQQTNWVAADLGVTGPCVTVSTACASSTSAMATALTLLDSDHVDAVIVGGADAYSLFTYAGFYALGAMGEKPMSPFSKDIGVTFGEGAGCIVIESEERARQRGATIHGTLLGCGTTSDAYHVTSPNPSGEGLQRAMGLALSEAGLTPDLIDYINAHGTGTQDNDVSETLAIRGLYKNCATIPPVSSSKSYFGHTLGAAGVLEFIASILGMKEGFLPPTLNFTAPRPGCDLDYVPNKPREATFKTFTSTSAAFGGVNAVAVGGQPGARRKPAAPREEILVTGLGVISPIGVGLEPFLSGLRGQANGVREIDRFDTAGLGCKYGGLVPEFKPRNLIPTVDVRRFDSLTRYAVLATAMAMQDAGLAGRAQPERVGLFVALTRGPVATQEAFFESLHRDGVAGLSARHFPSMVLSTLSGQIAQACRIKGASFTFVDGAGAGLVALIQAREYLSRHPELDAIVVVAADELAPHSYRMFDRLGRLASGAEAPSIYSQEGSGLILGEGSVAMVVEREDSVSRRNANAYGGLVGAAQGCEGKASENIDPRGDRLEAVARQAMAEAAKDIDLVYGQGRGVATHDMREARVLSRLLNGNTSALSCLNGQLGLAEAASGLFAASAALLGLRHGEAYPASGVEGAVSELPLVRGKVLEGDYRNALVLGSTESGNNFSVVFSNEGVGT